MSIPSGPTVHAAPLHPSGHRHWAVVAVPELLLLLLLPVACVSQAPWPPQTLPSRRARAHSSGQPCTEATAATGAHGDDVSTAAKVGAAPLPTSAHAKCRVSEDEASPPHELPPE